MAKPDKSAEDAGQTKGQATRTLKLDSRTLATSKRLAKKNKDYLDLLSIIEKSRRGFAAQQVNLKSRPAKEAASQLLRQLDLIFHMVFLPYLVLVTMEGYAEGQASVLQLLLSGTEPSQEQKKKIFEKISRTAMRRFFALDVSGSLSRPWLFAVTLYIWTAYECMAGDLWAASLNQATPLGHRVLTSIGTEDTEKSGLSRRQIDVGLAARYGFDLRHSLGTILKPKFDFGSCSGIEGAYKQAFGTCGDLLEDFRDTLRELEQVRHLIVHRGGVADTKFVRVTKLKVKPDKLLSLKLSQVGDYMMSVTMGCVALLHVVDGWFAFQGVAPTKGHPPPSSRIPR